MTPPLLVTDACTVCGLCVATCPEHALVRAARRPWLDVDRCTSCWACLEVCPREGALAVPGGAA